MNNKLIKFLIILNGLMLPLLLGFGIFMIVKEFLPRRQVQYQQSGLIVGEDLEEAKKDSIVWQGLDYDMPEEIYNSPNFLLKVGVRDYKKGEDISKLLYSKPSKGYYNSNTDLVNVVFLDKNYNVIRSLLDKKASISTIGTRDVAHEILGERIKSYSTITYLIAFEDNNGDGKLNSEDYEDLYISNLSGGNFTQVTKGVDVQNWVVDHDKGKVLVKYKERTNQEEEHRDEKYAIYSINDKKLTLMSGVNEELKKLESIIRE